MLWLAARLPQSRPASSEPYVNLLLSLFVLLRDQRELRNASLAQSLIFFGFSAFWTILTLLLQEPKFHLSSSAAGMFGVFALAGVVLAPYGVRMADDRAGLIGTGLVTASFILMIPLVNLVGLVIGSILMITGLQISLISHQSRILAAAGSARGRYNTVFMASQFTFGAAGSSAASLAWNAGGWTAVMAMAAAAAVAALLLQIGRHRNFRLNA
jgi:MFS family permease